MVKAAVDAEVSACIAQVERDVHADDFTETLLSVLHRQLSHLLEIRLCGRRDERHKVVDVERRFGERDFYIAVRFRGNPRCSIVPTDMF